MLSVSRNSCLTLFVQLRNKKHEIAVGCVSILVDFLLNLSGFLIVSCKDFNIAFS